MWIIKSSQKSTMQFQKKLFEVNKCFCLFLGRMFFGHPYWSTSMKFVLDMTLGLLIGTESEKIFSYGIQISDGKE